ncbi:MAG TPA: hypothetical protein VKE30_09110 [Chthoniobacterales bacterium]|nr:hypothetical protein [Chthoniobacterales bacterium]
MLWRGDLEFWLAAEAALLLRLLSDPAANVDCRRQQERRSPQQRALAGRGSGHVVAALKYERRPAELPRPAGGGFRS